VIDAHPELLGIGIDEDTAIVVQGDTFEVIGRSYVGIYDATHVLKPNGRFYLLAPRDRFDLKKREATRPTQQYQPFSQVVGVSPQAPTGE
jgi:cyanophycinase